MYQTSYKYTYDEFMRYQNSVVYKKALLRLLIGDILIFVVWSILVRNVLAILFLVGIACATDALLYLYSRKRVDKVWISSEKMHNLETKYVFNENEMEITNEFGNAKISYDNIYKIIETKTNFYIMISTIQGYIIVKENCSLELIDFIKNIKSK